MPVDDVREFLRLKEAAERLRKKADRAQGALEQLRNQLEQELGFRTVAEGEALLAKAQAKRDKLLPEARALREAFWQEYGDLLGAGDGT